MSEEEYTIDELEQLNASLASIESEAHNARSNVISALRLKRELRSGELTEEECEVAEADLEQKLESIERAAQLFSINLEEVKSLDHQ
jgi:ribosomal protein S13